MILIRKLFLYSIAFACVISLNCQFLHLLSFPLRVASACLQQASPAGNRAINVITLAVSFFRKSVLRYPLQRQSLPSVWRRATRTAEDMACCWCCVARHSSSHSECRSLSLELRLTHCLATVTWRHNLSSKQSLLPSRRTPSSGRQKPNSYFTGDTLHLLQSPAG
jgi:hypothetical protein